MHNPFNPPWMSFKWFPSQHGGLLRWQVGPSPSLSLQGGGQAHRRATERGHCLSPLCWGPAGAARPRASPRFSAAQDARGFRKEGWEQTQTDAEAPEAAP